MFTTNSNPVVYLYSCRREYRLMSFDTEAKLLLYMAHNYARFFGEHNSVNLTWNDTASYFSLTGEYVHAVRDLVLVDAYNRVLNPADYKEKVDALLAWYSVDAESKRRRIYKQVPHDELQYGDRLRDCNTNYRFRCDPVPGIGRNRWHFHCWYRAPKTTAELRDMANPENAPYIRRSRKQIPTAYDDIPQCIQRSWKVQSKKRKQWM